MDIGKTVVRFALRTISATGYFIISAIEWEQFRKVLSELENRQGRPFVHERVAILKGFIYGYAEGKTSVLVVWQDCTKSWTWKALGFSKEPSYDTFRRFLAEVEPLMDDLLQRAVNQCVEGGIISGGIAAMDTSKLRAVFKNADLDAKWNYDDTEEEYYYGYALHVVIDAATGLPLTFDLLRDKKIDYDKAFDLWSKVQTWHNVLLADSEYDIIDFQNDVLDERNLPIVEYNPRSAKRKKVERFRAEIYSLMDLGWLGERYKMRSSVERSFNTIKNDLRTKEFRVRGFERVKSHCGLHYLLRLGYVLAAKEKGEPVTKTVSAV